ncbi:MAG: efflux RND transporter periplasmic adaptor subunit [Pseudomonadota bacterium]
MVRKIKLISAAAGILLLAGAGAYFYGKSDSGAAVAQTGDDAPSAPEAPPPAIVYVAPAQSRQLTPLSDAPGSVVSTRDSLVAAATSGKVEWVADVGALVKAGDIIAKIEKTDARLARDNNAAQVKMLEARAQYLERNLKRFVDLGEDSGESEAAIDEMRVDAREAQQSLAQARVALERSEVDLQRTDVRAPFSGRIVTQEAQIGEFAGPGAPIARLVDTVNLEVTARAPSNLTRYLAEGDTVAVERDGETLRASVRAVVPVGDELSRMLELRLDLPDVTWHIGSAVRVRLPAAAVRTALAVHRDALILRADGTSIFLVDKENKARRIMVELGAADGDYIEVLGDIVPGARVVVRGGERLRDGQAVKIGERSADARA